MANKSDIVYYGIKDSIVKGEFLPGVHLIEGELMTKYNVSRSTIREAFRRLVDDELIDAVPNKGIKVRVLSNKELQDYYIVYEYLSGLCAKLAAANSNKSLIKKLTNIWERNKTALTNDDFLLHSTLGKEFHNTIALASQNQYLIKDETRVSKVIGLYSIIMPLKRRMKGSFESHKKIIDAIKNHDTELAEKIMREHIREAYEIVDKHLCAYPISTGRKILKTS